MEKIFNLLKTKVRGILDIFLLDNKGNVIFPEQITDNEDKQLRVIAQACSNNIALLEDSSEMTGEKLNIVEMELLAKDKRIYLQKIEISNSEYLLCIIGDPEKFNVGFAKAVIDAKVKDEIIKVLRAD